MSVMPRRSSLLSTSHKQDYDNAPFIATNVYQPLFARSAAARYICDSARSQFPRASEFYCTRPAPPPPLLIRARETFIAFSTRPRCKANRISIISFDTKRYSLHPPFSSARFKTFFFNFTAREFKLQRNYNCNYIFSFFFQKQKICVYNAYTYNN